MTSKVQAWNMALARIKSTANVQDELENSAEARYCALYHDDVLKWLLEEGQWPFAIRTAYLSLIGTEPDDWAYQYAYPSDCLSIIELLQADRKASPLPFKESLDETDSKVILCDIQSAQIRYVKNITDFTLLNSTAVFAYVEMLASYIASPLAKDEKMKNDYFDSAWSLMRHAKGKNKNRDRRDRSEESPFSEARY